MLELDEVSFGYGKDRFVFRGLSFALKEREIVGLFGRSGSGKSTILRIMAGLERPAAGEISLADRPLRGPTPDVGLMFQSYALFDWCSCLANIEIAMRMAGRSRTEGRVAMDYLKLVGLSEVAKSLPTAISGGMRQRLALARALAVRPLVLLLDEPFAALDVKTRADVVAMTFAHVREQRLSALVVSHDAASIVSHCDRLLVLRGSPAQLVVPHGIPPDLAAERSAAQDSASADALFAKCIEQAITDEIPDGGDHAP